MAKAKPFGGAKAKPFTAKGKAGTKVKAGTKAKGSGMPKKPC